MRADHSQCSAGDTEHHAGEEAGHIHAKVPAYVSAGLASPEVFQVAQADGVKPEHVVQSVVQAGGDEQTVQESIDTCADAAQAGNAVAQSNQNAEDNGPYEQQDNGYRDGNQSGYDSNAALAAEECQPVRELGAFEAVVAACADDSGQDADEGVAGILLKAM